MMLLTHPIYCLSRTFSRTRLIQTEGFPAYRGLAGRDLDAIAQGISKIIDEDCLRYRVGANSYIIERLDAMGVPVVKPGGGHGVLIDARAFLLQIQPLQYSGHALACALYKIGGIRGCEIRTVMCGRQPDGSEEPARMDLVRSAMPRRVYTQSHADLCRAEISAIKTPLFFSIAGFRFSNGTCRWIAITAR